VPLALWGSGTFGYDGEVKRMFYKIHLAVHIAQKILVLLNKFANRLMQ
jgi:hypothetical protein